MVSRIIIAHPAPNKPAKPPTLLSPKKYW